MTDDARAAQLLVRFKADLLALATSEAYGTSVHVVITGLVEVAEGLIRRALRQEPAGLPVILSQLDNMKARILASVATIDRGPIGPMN